ncbi:MAG: hypothetical protein AMK71_08170 [Nitrospira bacterium SG8_35_4]|nr:MAG: hypothetical protein AMK71_08170 [Nitrospira bacterium SG8_35_4]
MNVEVFVLCDAATDYQGKLNILGSFDSIWSKNIPAVIPHCALALRMRFLKIEEGEHSFRITIVNEDGQQVISPFETKLYIKLTDISTGSIARNMILNLQGLKFEKFGEYSIDLSVDGRHELSIPLYVNQVPEAV